MKPLPVLRYCPVCEDTTWWEENKSGMYVYCVKCEYYSANYKNKEMNKKQIPFEVLILQRIGDDDNPKVKIIEVNGKEVNIAVGTSPTAVAQAAAMRLGPEYADKADKIDVLVRPFVNG